jgi:5-methylcytosine-specific restriction endonuclease McrA
MTTANFTLDHIIPSSQGGKKAWNNIVACCRRCNQKKGNKSLKQAGMKLIRKPDTPVELVVENSKKFGRDIPKTWLDYIF